jgi:hypothetical protein
MSRSGALQLHVLCASGRLEPFLGVLRERAAAAFADAAALLDLGRQPVDVVIRDAPALTIPEFGIGGAAPDRHTANHRRGRSRSQKPR